MQQRKLYKSHGTGKFAVSDFSKIGDNVIFEPEVLVFHPENVVTSDVAAYQVYAGVPA